MTGIGVAWRRPVGIDRDILRNGIETEGDVLQAAETGGVIWWILVRVYQWLITGFTGRLIDAYRNLIGPTEWHGTGDLDAITASASTLLADLLRIVVIVAILVGFVLAVRNALDTSIRAICWSIIHSLLSPIWVVVRTVIFGAIPRVRFQYLMGQGNPYTDEGSRPARYLQDKVRVGAEIKELLSRHRHFWVSKVRAAVDSSYTSEGIDPITTPQSATGPNATPGWNLTILDPMELEDPKHADVVKKQFTRILEGSLYNGGRLEVIIYSFGDEKVQIYFREPGGPRGLGTALDKLDGVFVESQKVHPLYEFDDRVDIVEARTIKPTIKRLEDRALEVVSTTSGPEQPDGPLSSGDDLIDTLILELGTASQPALIHITAQSDRNNYLQKRREKVGELLEQADAAEPSSSGTWNQRRRRRKRSKRLPYFDPEGKPWIANIRVLTGTETDAPSDTTETTDTPADD